jgi:hypothetical protein
VEARRPVRVNDRIKDRFILGIYSSALRRPDGKKLKNPKSYMPVTAACNGERRN